MSTSAKPVFISYSTASGMEAARALHTALGDELVFRDEADLTPGEAFPAAIFDAEVNAQVIVCFVDEAYFNSTFCQVEWEIALAAYAAGLPDHLSLGGLVIVTPAGARDLSLQRMPPALSGTQWPKPEETARIAELVQDRLKTRMALTVKALIGEPASASLLERMQALTSMPARRMPPPELLSHGLPPMPQGGFYGRSRLMADILYRLKARGGSEQVALVAPGGGGKSRVAQEFIWRYGSQHFPGGLVWIDASSDETREQQLYELLAKLVPGLPPLPALSAAGVDVAKRLTEVLEERRAAGTILWVVDNVPEPLPGEAPKALNHWCPAGSSPVAVLATSRMKLHPPGINVDVYGLERPDSIQLLAQELEEGTFEEGEADRIAESIGDWPLALELLNRCFYTQALSPSEFLDHHTRTGSAQALDEAMEILQDQVPEGALRGISQTLMLSYLRLSDEAQRLATALAQYGPETIPIELVDALGNQLASARAKAALKTRSFVTGGGKDTFGKIHPLLADFLRGQEGSQDRLAEAADGLRSLVHLVEPRDPSTWPAQDRVAPHGLALLGRNGIPPPPALEVGLWLGTMRSSQSLLAEARTALERTVTVVRAALGPDHEGTIGVNGLLGWVHFQQGGMTQARDLLAKNLADARRALGDQHERTAFVQGFLAFVELKLGHLDEARALIEPVIEIRQRELGESHAETLKALNILSLVLLQQRKLQEARELIERVLTLQRQALGPEHPETLKSLHNLALVLRQQGDLEGAKKFYEEVIEIRTRCLGPEHPDTLGSLNNLGNVLWYMGDLPGAHGLFTQVLEAQKRVLGPDHPATLRSMYNVSHALKEQGNLAEARAMLIPSLERKLRVLGPDHPETKMHQELLVELEELEAAAST